MRFITITLIVHAPDPATGAQISTADRFREVIDPPWGWGGGPLGDDAVPASTPLPAAVSPVAATG